MTLSGWVYQVTVLLTIVKDLDGIYYANFSSQSALNLRSTLALFVLVFTIFGILLGFSASIDTNKNDKVNLAVFRVEDTLAGYIDTMKTASELPQMRSVKYADSISTAQMGIPADLDMEKRKVANQLIAEQPAFRSIFFLTPSGDIYLGEPFEQQKQLPRLNFADRDWYQGANSTRAPYISSVFMSAAINAPAIAVAIPIITQDQVIGYLVAVVDLSDIKSQLAEVSGESRILLVDQNGTEVADTKRTGQLGELQSYMSLQSVQTALAGRNRTYEPIEGATTSVKFGSLNANPNSWAVVVFE